jgi:hypothetical protein
MLDIPKRIALIDSLIEEDTERSLTYAALECRLALEYLCYERFKLVYSYLSPHDLKNWRPKYVVKQISDDMILIRISLKASRFRYQLKV